MTPSRSTHPGPRPVLIGLTGSIGSGKSVVAEIFRAQGATIIDADVLARESVKPGSAALKKIVDHFGDDILLPNGELNRKRLGGIVFSNTEKRRALEEIVHPEIRSLFQRELENHAGSRLIVYVIPLLFESGTHYTELDHRIVVFAPREICIERIMKRDSCSRELAEKKYDSQLPIEEKVARADHVIDNSGALDSLPPQVERVIASTRRS